MVDSAIGSVYIFANGMIMVFDSNGRQMPEYQGRRDDVIETIKAAYSGPIHETQWPSFAGRIDK